MKIHYTVEIENPEYHLVKVSLSGEREVGQTKLHFFLPSWSPGSYMIREYCRNIRGAVWAETKEGQPLFIRKLKKGLWEVDFTQSELTPAQKDETKFRLSYHVYAHELTVRTSHVDRTHAFLHGPSLYLGVWDESKGIPVKLISPTIEFRFPPIWSKISTGLKDISEDRTVFLYSAPDYDTLIDCPVEIGCQETDGFSLNGIDHELAFYGSVLPHEKDLKGDIKKVVGTIAETMGGVPYQKYTFITHFVPRIYGGLEHGNSTALHFDGRKLSSRKDYLHWISLVAHEYFHTWNVKRIRPVELGPFDYLNENYTRMLWLAEGLTSFMDDLFVFRAGISSQEEYVETIKGNLDSYFKTPGRKFQSLEESSFDAWIKLYRPDENSVNSSMSYYLKGGLVFMLIHLKLSESGKSIIDLIRKLWGHYLANPRKGITEEEFFTFLKGLVGEESSEYFHTIISGTQEIDFAGPLSRAGLELVWAQGKEAYLGIIPEFRAERVFVKSVLLDSPAYKAGVNAGDEVLFFNDFRTLKDDFENLEKWAIPGKAYSLTLSRLDRAEKVSIIPSTRPAQLKEIQVKDKDLVNRFFLA